MILKYIQLFFIFFKVGLFAIGGGLAAIPLIQDEVVERGWITQTEFTDMIAVSESTPGPIGVNIATYVGFEQYGVLGSIIATIGIVSPSVIIILIVSQFIMKFRTNKYVDGMFKGIRPAVTGLILTAAVSIGLITLVDLDAYGMSNDWNDLLNIEAIILFAIYLGLSNKFKFHPIWYIVSAGIIGVFIF